MTVCNYIAFGNTGYVEGDISTIEMPRERMFEYTSHEQQRQLEKLDDSSIEYIEKLPTFLCSEVQRGKKSVSMIVKLGILSNLKSDAKQVTASFETIVDYGTVKFANVEEARNIFEAEKWQLYRTHWAIRDLELRKIVNDLVSFKSDIDEKVVADAIERFSGSENSEPSENDREYVGDAEDIAQFLKHLYKLELEDGFENYFRGHADVSYELTPSLLRRSKSGAPEFLPEEDRMNQELRIAHNEDFLEDEFCFDRLVRMQHYGLPTRLLDISGNPLIALFFACDSQEDNTDGEVVIFSVKSEMIKYFNSDTVSCMANLSNLTYGQKNKITSDKSVKQFNKSKVGKKLLHHIQSEKSYFEPRIEPEHLSSVICVKAKQTNTRIKSQSGLFLLFGNQANMPEAGIEGIKVNRIRIKNKAEILKQLDRININASTVYPSIDRTAEHLKKKYKIDS